MYCHTLALLVVAVVPWEGHVLLSLIGGYERHRGDYARFRMTNKLGALNSAMQGRNSARPRRGLRLVGSAYPFVIIRNAFVAAAQAQFLGNIVEIDVAQADKFQHERFDRFPLVVFALLA